MKSPDFSVPFVTAIEVLRGIGSGSSGSITVVASDGNQYIVKSPSSAARTRRVIAEYLAARIGLQVSLSVAPRCSLIDLPQTLVSSIKDERASASLENHRNPAIGLAFIANSDLWCFSDPEPIDPIFAADLVWFDALIANNDRNPGNPNILRDDTGKLWAIDHDFALSVQEDWIKTDSRAQLDRVMDHQIGERAIRNHLLLAWSGALHDADQRLRSRLLPDHLEQFIDAIPQPWIDRGYADTSIDNPRQLYSRYLTGRLQAMDQIINLLDTMKSIGICPAQWINPNGICPFPPARRPG